MGQFEAVRVERDLAPIVARDELHDLLALSGSVRWGLMSGQLLRPLQAPSNVRTGHVTRSPQGFRAAA